MDQNKNTASILSMSFVVTGNLIGAGILALPIHTGLAGFWPSLAGNIVVWLMMLTTAFILAGQKSLTESETADLPSFFQKELGTAGKWVSVVANLIILYGLLVAYLSGASATLARLFPVVPSWAFLLLFFAAATTLTLFGMKIMAKGNALLMALMWISFLVMLVMAGHFADTSRFSYHDWPFFPTALPILVTAFHFHNLIPTLCRNMNHDQKAIHKAMIIGTAIGLAMNMAWISVVIGALPLTGDTGSLLSAFEKNQPATLPLAAMIQSTWFVTATLMFSLLAICTSYLANGTALTSFLKDLTSSSLGKSRARAVVPVLAFLPPLAITFIYPDIFLKALDVVGGVGIDLIFGIFPGILLIKYGSSNLKKGLGLVITAAFCLILILEVGQELGLLRILPNVEYWNQGKLTP